MLHTKLDLGAMANLHVHWGADTAGVMEVELDKGAHAPNVPVYDILEVLGQQKLRIAPAAKADTDSVYSIGCRAYGKFSVSNCDFFLLDTRSHRDMHDSINHAPAADEGGRPANGKFKFGSRECEIRWSSYVSEDIPRGNRTFPHYCVVQVNNVFNNPLERDGERWFAYPHPQVIFQFFNARTGELAYSETIVLGFQ